MPRRILIVSAVLILFAVFSKDAVLAQSRTTLRNDFGVELLGKAALYSFAYQRMVTPSVGLQAGFAALGGSITGDEVVLFFTLNGTLYFTGGDASPFLTGGVVLLTSATDSGPVESVTYGNVGLGFEYRSPGGFLFRGSIYTLFAEGDFLIWPGLQVSYAF